MNAKESPQKLRDELDRMADGTPLSIGCGNRFDECHERVIVVNEYDQMIGTAQKLEAHKRGLLHRAFSIFVVDTSGDILIQRRAAAKYHSPNRWSNTCCGHPQQGETTEEAAHRRLREEMGFDCELRPAGVFRYRVAVGSGLIEHEIDHLFVGLSDEIPAPNSAEVSDWLQVSPQTLAELLAERPSEFSGWLPYAFAHVQMHLPTVGSL